ncbi:MAG: DUF4176 domain-containing protein [Ruminococcus sp.]|nr:DUF4176 domain-containing protein [Ruminococcus sp.]
MEKVEFLPLGSIVKLRGSIRKAIIVSRGLLTVIDNRALYFDYGGALYPEGIVGDQILYFNHQDIEEVVFRGYENEENTEMVKHLQNWMEKSDAEKGNPYEINKKNGRVK